jgi:integrase
MKGYKREVPGRRQGRSRYWELVVEAERDPVTKRRRQVRRGFRGTETAADKALRELAREIDAGRHRSTDGTLGFVLERWLAMVEDDLSPTTVREYRRLVDKRIRPAVVEMPKRTQLVDVPLRKLEADVLDTFYADLRAGGLAPASIRQIHAIIRRALNQAVQWRWVDANVASRATPPRVRKHEISPPTPTEALRLLTLANKTNPELGAFLDLDAATGARRGELCGLRWSDFDAEARTLLIARSIVVVDGRTIVKDTKTHAMRRVTLGTQAAARLQRHRAAMEARARAGRTAVRPDSYIFSARLDGSQPWNPDHATKLFVTLRKNAKADRVRLHDLRHMHATELIDAGVPLPTVSRRLGHAQTSTTANIYAHPIEETDRRAADVMDALLDPDTKDGPSEPN